MTNKIKTTRTFKWVGIGSNLRYKREDYVYSNVKYAKYTLQVKKRAWFFGLLGPKEWKYKESFSGVPRLALNRMLKYVSAFKKFN